MVRKGKTSAACLNVGGKGIIQHFQNANSLSCQDLDEKIDVTLMSAH